MGDVIDLVDGVDFSVNVISKSGTTTEPAVAFRFFRKLLEERYGREGARERIFATTDRQRGALKALADSEGWETFVVPDDIGGRYSVLTAVGLLPIAVAGVDIDGLMHGAAVMMERCAVSGYECPAWRYAAARYQLYRDGKSVEILGCFDPAFRMGAADLAADLLETEDSRRAEELAQALCDLNRERQTVEQDICADAMSRQIPYRSLPRFGAKAHSLHCRSSLQKICLAAIFREGTRDGIKQTRTNE